MRRIKGNDGIKDLEDKGGHFGVETSPAMVSHAADLTITEVVSYVKGRTVSPL